MATTTSTRPTSLIRNLRNRLRRTTKSALRRQGEGEMPEIVRRGEYAAPEWDPFRAMREMMRLDPFRAAMMAPQIDREAWAPCVEVRENGTGLKIIADVPGVKPEDLEVAVSGNRLTISGHRETEERSRDESVYSYERQYGQFIRTFTLPDDVELDHITSQLRDGVLTVVVPRSEAARSRKIQIGSASSSS